MKNDTSGAFTLTIKGTTGTGAAIAAGTRSLIITDGTNFYAVANDAAAVLSLPLAIGSGGTGQTSAGAALAALGGVAAAATILQTLADVKGDSIWATAANVWARLAVGTDGQVLVADSGETPGAGWKDRPYDIPLWVAGLPEGTARLIQLIVGRPFTLPIALAGSQFSCDVDATAPTEFTIRKRVGVTTTDCGTLTFETDGSVTVVFTGAIQWPAGSWFILDSPAQDASLADCAFYFLGTLDA